MIGEEWLWGTSRTAAVLPHSHTLTVPTYNGGLGTP